MATKTKRQADADPRDEVQRMLDAERQELSAQLRLLAEIEQEQDDEITAATLNLSSERYYYLSKKMGLDSPHEIVRLLQRHRTTRELRDQVGDPAVLVRAQQAEAEAIEAERTTKAAADDIAAVDARGVPALIKQIETLQGQLEKLSAAREAATAEVQRIKNLRGVLRSHAPEALKRRVEQDVTVVSRGSADYQRIGQIKALLIEMQRVVGRWQSESVVDRDRNLLGDHNAKAIDYVSYCQAHLPQALEGSLGSQAVDLKLFAAEIERLRTEEIPALTAEKAAREKAWAEMVQSIEAPIEFWMRTGELAG